jgi:hypothetical protein
MMKIFFIEHIYVAQNNYWQKVSNSIYTRPISIKLDIQLF